MRKEKDVEQRHREDAHAREMFAKVERYLKSALSQAVFCEREGLAYWTFRYWLKKYRLREVTSLQTRMNAATKQAPPDFIPLHIAPTEPAASSSTCEIEYPSGIVIRFHGAVNAEVITHLLRTPPAEP